MNTDYSRALRVLRAVLNISQQKLAHTTGLSTSLISRIESGKRKLSKRNLQTISEKMLIPKELIQVMAFENKIMRIKKDDYETLGRALLEILSISKKLHGKEE